MSGSSEAFETYAAAVDALRSHFPAKDLAQAEKLDKFEFSADVDVGWLKSRLPALARLLSPAHVDIHLALTADGAPSKWRLRYIPSRPVIDLEAPSPIEQPVGVWPEAGEPALAAPGSGGSARHEPLPPPSGDGSATATGVLAVDLDEGTPIAPTPPTSLDGLLRQMDTLGADGVSFTLRLDLFLDKSWIKVDLTTATSPPKIVGFLFQDALVRILSESSLAYFEEKFCEPRQSTLQRIIIPVFDYDYCLHSDVLLVCGRGHDATLDAWLRQPLPDEVLKRFKKTLDFRKAQGVWSFPTRCLTPDTFALIDGEATSPLAIQFMSFRALLSAIFLADSVEKKTTVSGTDEEVFTVEFHGFGRVGITISRASLQSRNADLETLYKLYAYAFEGFSADKLEFAQRFLSLFAEDLATLCGKATKIRDATQKTYEHYLEARVQDYFDARQQIQERIKTAVAETTKSVIDLSREVSSDVYKIAGILVAAVVGAFIKPDLTVLAFMVASLVLVVYLILVVFYHLKTFNRTFELRRDQHRGYIESFRDILRDEIDTFLADQHLRRAKDLFNKQCETAQSIYLVFLILFVTAAIFSGYLQFLAP